MRFISNLAMHLAMHPYQAILVSDLAMHRYAPAMHLLCTRYALLCLSLCTFTLSLSAAMHSLCSHTSHIKPFAMRRYAHSLCHSASLCTRYAATPHTNMSLCTRYAATLHTNISLCTAMQPLCVSAQKKRHCNTLCALPLTTLKLH